MGPQGVPGISDDPSLLHEEKIPTSPPSQEYLGTKAAVNLKKGTVTMQNLQLLLLPGGGGGGGALHSPCIAQA